MTVSPWLVRWLEVTDSTNDDVRHAAEVGAPEGAVIAARQQKAGRGRQGRVWQSPSGNLYASVLLRPTDLSRQAGFYSFLTALAVFDALKKHVPETSLCLKWPNDVLLDGKKISGVLLEIAGDALIVGVGINIAAYPETALYPATSLAAEGLQVTPEIVLEAFLDALGHWHSRFQQEGFEPVRQAWLRHAKTGPLTVRRGDETQQGTFAGIDERGHLRLLLADGAECSISTGDVIFAPKG